MIISFSLVCGRPVKVPSALSPYSTTYTILVYIYIIILRTLNPKPYPGEALDKKAMEEAGGKSLRGRLDPADYGLGFGEEAGFGFKAV